MGIYLSESGIEEYKEIGDYYNKFFMYGSGKYPVSRDIRIFNKIGLAYGFVVDNAYVVDLERGIEFLLSAVVYVNDNKTLNDGIYEYDSIGIPFLTELGRVIYQYEVENPHQIKPDLEAIKRLYIE